MDTWRGHAIKLVASNTWAYADTGERVMADPDRSCGHCQKPNTPEGHDGCLGTLPGVVNACCGHGVVEDAYVQFADGRSLSGEDAVKFFCSTISA